MSNPFKAVGKVFKKVVHSTVGKVIVGALMVGAVVLTGGAALGALPAIGSVLGSVGISGTLASVLGGAISMGAVGALTGGVGGLISGKGFLKGATTGFLTGAASGGVLGGVGAISANGLLGDIGIGSQASLDKGLVMAGQAARLPVATAAATGPMTAAGSAAGQVGAAVPTSVTTSATTAASAAGASQAAGTGGFGGLLGSGGIGPLLQAGGSIISGFASGKAAEAQNEAELQAQRDKYDRIAYNYGYRNIYDDKKSNVPTSQEQVYAMNTPEFLTPYSSNPGGLLRTAPSQFIQPSYQYQIVNGQVVPVPVATG